MMTVAELAERFTLAHFDTDLNVHANLNSIRQHAAEVLDLCEQQPERIRPVLAALTPREFATLCAGLRHPHNDMHLLDALHRIRQANR